MKVGDGLGEAFRMGATRMERRRTGRSERMLGVRAARKDLSFEPAKEDFAGDPKLREGIETE